MELKKPPVKIRISHREYKGVLLFKITWVENVHGKIESTMVNLKLPPNIAYKVIIKNTTGGKFDGT